MFSAIGRLGGWRRTLLIGNPSSDLSVKQYLKEFSAEQLRASFAPKQAVPPFADKLLLLSRHIEKTSADTSISRIQSLLVFLTAGDLKTLAIKRLIDRYRQTSSKFGQIVMHHIAYFWHKFI